jgi:hypothetical protein
VILDVEIGVPECNLSIGDIERRGEPGCHGTGRLQRSADQGLRYRPESQGGRSADTEPEPSTRGGPGFLNPAQNETIYDTIVVTDNPDAAARGLEGLKNDLPKKVTGAPQPADVGTGGMIASGTSPDGSKAITEVTFTEGRAVVNLEFESPANDPVQPETAIAVAHMWTMPSRRACPASPGSGPRWVRQCPR